MGLHPVSKLFTSVTLFLLAAYHTSNDNACCQAAISPLTDLKKDGYSRLVRDIKAHSIVTEKIPPKITMPAHAVIAQTENGDDGDAVNVTLNLMPVDIISLDPAEQVLELSGYISLLWYDTDLTWNSSQYGGVMVIEMPSSQLWTPPLSVLNGVERNDLIIDGRAPLFLYSHGMVVFAFSVNLKTSCKLDLMFFPFDEQSCEIIIYTLSQNRMSVYPGMQNLSRLLEGFSVGGEWSLTDTMAEAIPGFEYRTENIDTKITLKLRRKRVFYLMSVVGPMGLFTMMNCLVFVIPPESGEKVSFLISIFLSNAVFSSFINGVMPRGLETQVPLLMIYLAFMWVWSAVTFLATILVLTKFHNEHSGNANPDPLEAGTTPDPSQETWNPGLMRRLLTRLGGMVTRENSRTEENQVQGSIRFINSQRPSNKTENLHGDGSGLDHRPSFAQGQHEDHSPIAAHAHCDSFHRVVEKNDLGLGIKAKTLDRIFLILSLVIVAVADTIVIMVAVLFN